MAAARVAMKIRKNRMSGGKSIRVVLLASLLVISGQSQAWIAFGFKSGMSRFDVVRYLSNKESWVINDGSRQTSGGPDDAPEKYTMIYCSRPQKLYLMQFRPGDSLEQFEQLRKKFEKRYGEPTPLNTAANYRESATWDDVDVSFIWDLNELETILLKHDRNGTRAEFQDLSVCN